MKQPITLQPLPMAKPLSPGEEDCYSHDSPALAAYAVASPLSESDLLLPSGSAGPVAVIVHAEPLEIRLAFIRKVYTILTLQLLTTFSFSLFFSLNTTARALILSSTNALLLSMIASIATICALTCLARRHPHNLLLLFLFTVLEAHLLSFVCAAYYERGLGAVVLQAVGLTAGVFLSLTAFTFQSKVDFTFLGAGLSTSLTLLLLWSAVQMIFGYAPGAIYSLLSALVFSGYIVFDTFLLLRKLGPEDYVVAAVSLYLDVINLFLAVLRLLTNDER